MKILFLTLDGQWRDSWKEAFPDALCAGFDAGPQMGADVVFALLPRGQAPEQLLRHLRNRLLRQAIVVMSDEPDEDVALAALSAGAVGYCNGHAAPEVLQQVAPAVRHGSIWVGQALMQRLLGATMRLLPPQAPGQVWRERLSVREQETAELLARGASNKEIARELDITERTVKAHVSALLEKLGARDRLQLSLIINGIEAPR